MPLAPSLLGRKCWPYAKTGPQDSVGEYRGILNPAKLAGRIHCWTAKGDALLLFNGSIKPKLLEFLSKNSEKIHESSDYLCILMYMVGKRQEKSKPVVFFVSDDEAARKEAFDMVKASKILDSFPGIELGHTNMGKMMALAGKLDTVLGRSCFYQDGTSVLRLVPESLNGQQDIGISAVGGGVLECQGRFYILTANHFLDGSPRPLAMSASNNEEVAIDTTGCEITGLSDFDDESDEDDDENTFGSVEATSQGSISESNSCHSESQRDSGSSNFTLTPLKLDDSLNSQMIIPRNEELDQSGVHEPSQLSTEEDVLSVGTIVSFSRELDYALIEVSESSWDQLPIKMLPEALSCSNRHAFVTSPGPAWVWTVTPSKGKIEGLLSDDPQDIRFPYTKSFTRVFVATFQEPLRPGDCGSWVRDAVTGQLYGHIVAGTVDDSQAFMVPISSVLGHASLPNRVVSTEFDILTIAVAEFQQHVSEKQVSGLAASGEQTPYLPFSQLERYWKRPHALNTLETLAMLCHQGVQTLQQEYVRILSILLYIGHPRLLDQFVSSGHNDSNLPYSSANNIPLGHGVARTNNIEPQADDFFNHQWRFLPVTFSEQVLSESKLGSRAVLPVKQASPLEGLSFRGGDVVSAYVRIRSGYGNFTSPDIPNSNLAIFRRYPQGKSLPAAEKIQSIRLAIAEFAPSTEQLQFQLYGSFIHGLGLITVLPYPINGTLADLMNTDGKPDTSNRMIRLWSGLSDTLRGLDTFLIARDKGLNTRSYHLELTPAKIMLFPGRTDGVLDFKPKLDVLGPALVDLTLEPTDEIWGLGSVFSEVLVWTTMGADGVKDYKDQRTIETRNHELFFRHALSKRLGCVENMHKQANKDRSHGDELTPKLSDIILLKMLQPGKKYNPGQILDSLLDILSQHATPDEGSRWKGNQ